MNENIKEINICNGYAGAISIKATAESGRVFIIEKEHLIEYLLDQIQSKGYKKTKEGRQAYERLIINK